MPKGAKGARFASRHSKICRPDCLRKHELRPSLTSEGVALAAPAGTKGVGRRGTHSHKSKKTHKLGLRSTFLERHIDQVECRLPTSCVS